MVVNFFYKQIIKFKTPCTDFYKFSTDLLKKCCLFLMLTSNPGTNLCMVHLIN